MGSISSRPIWRAVFGTSDMAIFYNERKLTLGIGWSFPKMDLPNPEFNRTTQQCRCWVLSAFRASAAGQRKR